MFWAHAKERWQHFALGDSQKTDRWLLILILLIALTFRVGRAVLTSIINPDAALYIYQAKAIYYGLWPSVNTCSLPYLTVLPLLTAGFYPLFQDWVISARAVSIMFGTLTLVPLYLLARFFFSSLVSGLITLTFAVMPVFVSTSVDVVRDPASWLFSMSGFYFFTKGILRNRPHLFAWGSMFFLLATWTRIEAVLYFAVSVFYLFVRGGEQKSRKLQWFLSPVITAVIVYIFIQWVVLGKEVYGYRFLEIPSRIMVAWDTYQTLRVELLSLIQLQYDGPWLEFLKYTRTLIWFVGVGVLLKYVAEAFFYPVFFILVLGIACKRRTVDKGPVLYYGLLAVGAVILLYANIFSYWVMTHRFVALLILPCFIFVGFGIERIIDVLTHRYQVRAITAMLLLVVFVMGFAAPNNLRPHERDKVVFKEIGRTIANEEGCSQGIDILTLGTSYRWVSLYANLDAQGVCCPDKYFLFDPFPEIVGRNYGEFLENVRSRGVQYVLWEERNWPSKEYNLPVDYDPRDFRIVGQWHHKDTGRLVLFKKF